MQTNLHLYHKVFDHLQQWLPGERVTRQRNMALLVSGLFLSGSIYLTRIVSKWPSESKEPSLVNRLHRFLNNGHVDVEAWYEPLAREILGRCSGERLYLVIDCTKVGSKHRLMTVGVAYKKRVLPLAWSVHRGSRGHTSAKEQIALLDAVRRVMPAGHEVWVLGDSEFQSVRLLEWLRRQGWHFIIRQRSSNKVCQAQGEWTKLSDFELAPGQTRYLGWVRLTEKHDASGFWLVLHWQVGEDEPWYLVSDRQEKRTLINRYRVRMWTEETYGDMKGHGFEVEATHLEDPARISRLFLAVCFAFVWLIALGSWVVKNGLRHFVDHKSRRDKSYFRIGWDWVERCLRLGKPVPIRFAFYP